MKHSKYVFSLILTAFLVVFAFVFSADAQRGRGGSFGGGRSAGGHIGGGRPSGGTYGGRPSGGHYVPPQRVYAGTSIRRAPSYYRPGIAYPGRFVRPYYYGRYSSFYAPRLGFQLSILPFGYSSFYYGPNLFYYYDGIFYRNYNDSYEVVAPPVGAEVSSLPKGTSEITINGEQYYEKNGVYYREVVDQDGKKAYQVAGKDGELNTGSDAANLPQLGDIVNELPKDSRSAVINGDDYYISPAGVYYQETSVDNHRAYKVVGTTANP